MEQNNNLTAQQSLQIISETFNNSRKGILRNSAKYFMLWGALLTVTSLVVYFLWHLTGKPQWNFLWFAMPAIGYPAAALLGRSDVAVPQSEVSKMLSSVWGVFGAFAVTLHPFDIQQQADAIHEALTMPVEERRGRRDACVKVVQQNDVAKWLQMQLADISRTAAE